MILLKLRKDVWISCCRHFGIQILSDSSCSQKRGVFWVYIFWPFVHQVASYDTAENYLPPEDFQRDKWLGKAFQQGEDHDGWHPMPKLPDITLPGKLTVRPWRMDGWKMTTWKTLGQGRFAVSFRGGYVFFLSKNTLGGIFSLACIFCFTLKVCCLLWMVLDSCTLAEKS